MTWWNNGNSNFSAPAPPRPTGGGDYGPNADLFEDLQESEMAESICNSTGFRELHSVRTNVTNQGLVTQFACVGCGRSFRLLTTWAELYPMSMGLSPNLVGWTETTWNFDPTERGFKPVIQGHRCDAARGMSLVIGKHECEQALQMGMADRSVLLDPNFRAMVQMVVRFCQARNLPPPPMPPMR